MAQTTTSRRRALTALIRPDSRRWAVLGALIAAASAGALAGPLIVRRIVDEATEGTTAGDIVRLGVLFLVVAIITQVLNVVVVRSATVAAWRITNGLRLDITRHVLSLDHEFHRKHTPGELIQRVDGDVTNVSNFLSQVVPKVAGAVIVLSGMLGVLDRARLATRSGDARLPRYFDAPRAQHASPSGARVVGRDGNVRQALRGDRGASDGGRRPARQRCRESRHVAFRRGQCRGDLQRRATGGRVPADVVGAADRCRHRTRRHLGAVGCARQQWGHHVGYRVVAVPVRAPDDPPVGGARRSTRGDPEGQRSDAPGRTSCSTSSQRSSTAAQRRRRRVR